MCLYIEIDYTYLHFAVLRQYSNYITKCLILLVVAKKTLKKTYKKDRRFLVQLYIYIYKIFTEQIRNKINMSISVLLYAITGFICTCVLFFFVYMWGQGVTFCG